MARNCSHHAVAIEVLKRPNKQLTKPAAAKMATVIKRAFDTEHILSSINLTTDNIVLAYPHPMVVMLFERRH
jgi:hypothetical protein